MHAPRPQGFSRLRLCAKQLTVGAIENRKCGGAPAGSRRSRLVRWPVQSMRTNSVVAAVRAGRLAAAALSLGLISGSAPALAETASFALTPDQQAIVDKITK